MQLTAATLIANTVNELIDAISPVAASASSQCKQHDCVFMPACGTTMRRSNYDARPTPALALCKPLLVCKHSNYGAKHSSTQALLLT